MSESAAIFARLPSVERVLTSQRGVELARHYAHDALAAATRSVLEDWRSRIRQGAVPEADLLEPNRVAEAVGFDLATRTSPRIRSVVNATGVVLHTNLGRALLAPSAIQAAVSVAAAACNLEYDLAGGSRGDRDGLVEEHLCALTGAEAATVVNNNAAAVLLVLNSLAEGRGVVVSRGELVEIGGSFRIPDVMAKSGACLREVGTTNRTHGGDYQRAIDSDTAMLLKVHTSNYRIVGFTASVDLPELAEIARGHQGVAVVEDLGSGALVDLQRWGLPAEPVVADRLEAGADLVTFSGDKLLGGPQCGIVAGRRELVDRVRRNPLKRALRCDKMTLAALEATLRLYRFDPEPQSAIPTLAALTRPVESLAGIATEAAAGLAEHLGPDFEVSVEPSSAEVGSGSQPGVVLPSMAVVIVSSRSGPDAVAARFRSTKRPIIGRIEKDRFLLDLRTVESADDLLPHQPVRPA